MIPVLMGLPSTIESKLNNVDVFNIDTNFTTIQPITIPNQHPVLIINYNNQTPAQSANIILNNNMLYAGALFKNYELNISGYGDVKQKASEYASVLTAVILMMLPTILVISYIYLAIKYFILILIAAVLVKIISAMLSYRTNFSHIFNSAMYGVSLTVFLDIIFFATNFEFYYIQYVPLLIYTFCGVTAKGEKLGRDNISPLV